MNLDSKLVIFGTIVSIVKKINKQTKELYLILQFLKKNSETNEVKLFEVKVQQAYLHNFKDIDEGSKVKVEIDIKTFNSNIFIYGIKLLK